MPLSTPHPGLIINYAYLWRNQQENGEVSERKNRPCAIVAAIAEQDGETTAIVFPITHSEPEDPRTAVEIPPRTKQRLGLDSERSWIICSEANKFIWPSPDLIPISSTEPGKFSYGVLPPKLLDTVKTRAAYLRKGRQFKVISRDE